MSVDDSLINGNLGQNSTVFHLNLFPNSQSMSNTVKSS